MARRVIVKRKIRREIDDTTGSYSQIGQALGARFHQEIMEILSMLEIYPQMYPEIRPRIRRAIVHGFPYSLFYVIRARTVNVIALFHQAENPKKWPN